MDTQLTFIVVLEAVALVLAIFAIWTLILNKRTHNQKKIEAALESHLHGVLTAELEVVEKELKKAVVAATKDASGLLKSNHEKLTAESQQLLSEFSETINTDMTAMLKEQHQAVTQLFAARSQEMMEELAAYKAERIAEIDTKSDELLHKLLQRKAWKTVQGADQHKIAKQALQEVLASGELTL